MKSTLFLWFSALLTGLLACSPPAELQTPPSPDLELGPLFVAVQTAKIFPDSKTFADAELLVPASQILEAYEEERVKPGFELKAFVSQHFKLPEKNESHFKTDPGRSITGHINALWPVLTRRPTGTVRGSLLALPRSYVVPGGRFREMFYWDTYFTMLGLQVAGRDTLIEGMVENFAHLIRQQGHIPNANRSYFLSRSQPPFFSLMVRLLADARHDPALLTKYLPELQSEYYYWMAAVTDADRLAVGKLADYQAHKHVVKLPSGLLLNRYYDDRDTPRPEAYNEELRIARTSSQPAPQLFRNLRAACESGWDFSSRWMADGQTMGSTHATDIVPIDLNCLLFMLEKTLADGYAALHDRKNNESFSRLADKRLKAIQTFFWNPQQGHFSDYDFVKKQFTPVLSMATAVPLFTKTATPDQARKTAQVLKDRLLQAGGFTTTLNRTGQQWDAPNGWAPLQYMGIAGLRNYGETALADEAARRWVALNQRVYNSTGKLMEKYNVYDTSLLAGGGEYPLQDGFGWTNGVLLALLSETRQP